MLGAYSTHNQNCQESHPVRQASEHLNIGNIQGHEDFLSSTVLSPLNAFHTSSSEMQSEMTVPALRSEEPSYKQEFEPVECPSSTPYMTSLSSTTTTEIIYRKLFPPGNTKILTSAEYMATSSEITEGSSAQNALSLNHPYINPAPAVVGNFNSSVSSGETDRSETNISGCAGQQCGRVSFVNDGAIVMQVCYSSCQARSF